jgi:hypothetical protein
MSFGEVFSLRVTGGLLSLSAEKREGTPPRLYDRGASLSSGYTQIALSAGNRACELGGCGRPALRSRSRSIVAPGSAASATTPPR